MASDLEPPNPGPGHPRRQARARSHVSDSVNQSMQVSGAIPAALLIAVALLGGCGDAAVFPPVGPTLAVGTWGGDDAGVIVTESGAHVHVGCTYGDISGTIPLDADRRFAVDGSYQPRAHPIVTGPPVPARFSGRVVGRTLTLAIAVDDTVEGGALLFGPVDLVYGREPEMRICPICRVPGQRLVLPSARSVWPNIVP
jgi:hypothetical protein